MEFAVALGLTSLYIRIPKRHERNPGKMTFTTASGDCRLRPAGAERSSLGNAISVWAGRLYVSKRNTPGKFPTASLRKCATIESKSKEQSGLWHAFLAQEIAAVF